MNQTVAPLRASVPKRPTAASFLVIALLVAVFAGGGVFSGRIIRRQDRELAELQRVLRAAKARRAEAARERRAVLRREAQRPVDGAALAVAEAALATRNAEIKAWLGRVHALQALFAAHPAAAIPEMTLLTSDDWLRAAKDASLDDDAGVRRAMAAVRGAAKSKFGQLAIKALARAQAAQAKPATAADLALFFDPPVNVDILNRYILVSAAAGHTMAGVVRLTGGGGGLPGSGYALHEKAPVDEVYDGRATFFPGGTVIQSAGPLGWEDGLAARVEQAFRTYAAEHGDAMSRPSVAQVIPYVQPPLDPATAQRLVEAEQARTRR